METLHRLFFALRPPAREARLIGLVRDALDRPSSIVTNERLHMTLGITNDYRRPPNDVIDRMMAIGDTVATDPVPILLDRLSGGVGTVALKSSRRIPQLTALQKPIQRLLDYWGLTRAEWTFNPHFTLIYWQGQPFIRPVTPIEWLADEMVLIHSLVGERRHIVLARWPIASRQQSLSLF